MSQIDHQSTPPHIPIQSDKETSIQHSTQADPSPPRLPHKPQHTAHTAHRKKDGLSRYEKVRSLMLIKAEKLVEELGQEEFCPVLENQFSKVRRGYRVEIYKYLLFGYQELVKQWDIKKTLKQPQPNTKILQFIHNASNFQQIQLILKQRSVQIENKLLQYHNTAGSLSKQSQKYRLQMKHLLNNLGDIDNRQFREDVVIGKYQAEDIAGMSFIDMMDQRKKMYVFTKCPQLLSYQFVNAEKNRRQETYERQIIRKAKNKKRQALTRNVHKNMEEVTLEYLVSEKFVEKLEIELMEIPMKSIRKATLLNLKQVFE